MKKSLISLIIILFPICIYARSLVLQTSYDTFTINEITHTITNFDIPSKTTIIFKIEEVERDRNGDLRIKATSKNQTYLFEIYVLDNSAFITIYHYKSQQNPNVRLFETARGKINLDDFYDFHLRNLDDDIKRLGLTGDAARAFREESIKYLDGIKSGNITKLNSNNTFNITDATNFKDYRNWNPKIKKGSIWKGTSDSYIQDADYGRNKAIGHLSRYLNQWGIYKELEKKEWVKLRRSEIKSFTEE